ncbi:MAG: hypothetical protein HS111_25755 [Kofleriaceae bacterium]|nr:hypothetical protein [Kofleriaceae bacterium]
MLNTLTAELNCDPQRWNGGTPQIRRHPDPQRRRRVDRRRQPVGGAHHRRPVHDRRRGVGLPISNGQTATIPITFDPTSVGAKTDTVTLSLNNDAPSEPNVAVALSGTGTQSTRTFNPTSLSIGTF